MSSTYSQTPPSQHHPVAGLDGWKELEPDVAIDRALEYYLASVKRLGTASREQAQAEDMWKHAHKLMLDMTHYYKYSGRISLAEYLVEAIKTGTFVLSSQSSIC